MMRYKGRKRDENGKKIKGSRTARNFLKSAINNEATVTVDVAYVNGSRTTLKGNKITLDYVEIDATISGTSSDLNNTTFGFAMSFLHELNHTSLGIRGGVSDRTGSAAGENEDFLNIIRNELSETSNKSYGNRLTYEGFGSVYNIIPFSNDALLKLQHGFPSENVRTGIVDTQGGNNFDANNRKMFWKSIKLFEKHIPVIIRRMSSL